MMHRLAVNNAGIAILAEKIVSEDLIKNRLCRVLSDWEATPISIYAVTETCLIPAKTQRFIEFLKQTLKKL
ncbi:LysR substrate-binding domain-containing protein [Proteus mirabilis]|uniref:LysR substrate-binding domain-containing protein n=1 Tax=Proteus mirabilis TaxID=584 RepID=UPI00318A7ABD